MAGAGALDNRAATPARTLAFSDGVFTAIITILVLDLHPPDTPTVDALLSLWPGGLSYGASYLFLAIVWLNHHYLMRYADLVTPQLLWANFAHLFPVSLVPFATAWSASTHLAAVPVAAYAGIFVLVNATYLMLCWGSRSLSCREAAFARPSDDANALRWNPGGICLSGAHCVQVPGARHGAHLHLPAAIPSARSPRRSDMNRLWDLAGILRGLLLRRDA